MTEKNKGTCSNTFLLDGQRRKQERELDTGIFRNILLLLPCKTNILIPLACLQPSLIPNTVSVHDAPD